MPMNVYFLSIFCVRLPVDSNLISLFLEIEKEPFEYKIDLGLLKNSLTLKHSLLLWWLKSKDNHFGFDYVNEYAEGKQKQHEAALGFVQKAFL